MPTQQQKGRLSQATSLKTVPSRICTKYEKVYEDGPNTKRVIYIRKKHNKDNDTTSISPSICGFFKDYTEAASMDGSQRLKSGKQPTQIVNIVPSFTVCNVKPEPKNEVEMISENHLKPNIIHVQIENTPDNRNWERYAKCLYLKQTKRPRKMNRGTQTLYRESSAQTLPYLPGVSNNKEALETLELFKLPKILKGDGPPGLYEVEILERARKRWAFEKAIKKEFECKMKAARTEYTRKKQLAKHKHIMEAFEWEHWLQREEAIQSYQMMRFDLVIRIFEKREREMHQASNQRIQICCQEIAAKRDKALKKNEIEYSRLMRRMKVEHEKKPRNWRKEKISDQLGDPSSEYYAPQMRYGVNPNRRHFQLSRKAFEMRMEDLEKRAVNMKKLECPFAKLKEWSKPKELKQEVEQNFCTDTNLKKLYESLKGLREQSKKHKIIPKCLKEKTKYPVYKEVSEEEVTIEDFEFVDEEQCIEVDMDDEAVQVGVSYSHNSLVEMFSQRDSNNLSLAELLNERRREELEGMLAEYEGTKIGWLMRFLSEEMGRLQEQRKLHFITMLAQKERWRREAAEAGLRQKENEMRRIYEEIFNETDIANKDVCEQYLDNIFGIDTREQADFEAINSVTDLAKTIDADLQRWVNSFHLIQHPLNYDDLRWLLRDLVFPENLLECLVRQYEATSVVDYIINDVLFPEIYTLLEPFDVVSPLTNDMIDRLVDNDLYLFSSECSSGCDCFGICECTTPELEAKAIMRKVIRYAVPGRRWRTETERIADENVKDIVDDACKSLDLNKRCAFTGSRKKRSITKIPSRIDLLASKLSTGRASELQPLSTDTTAQSSRFDTVTIITYRKEQPESVTKSLTSRHVVRTARTDTNVSSRSLLLDLNKFHSASDTDEFRPSLLRKITSALDIRSIQPDESIPPKSSDTDESTDNEFELITRTPMRAPARLTESFLTDLFDDVVRSFLPDNEVVEENAATSSSVVGKGAANFALDKLTSQIITDDYIENASTDFETEKGTKFEHFAGESYEGDYNTTSEYTMVLYEGELKRILQEDDECKCQMEIDYKNHIKALYESGKIRVIYKEPRMAEGDSKDLSESEPENVPNLSDMVFEYASSHVVPTSLDKDLDEDQGEEEFDELTENIVQPENLEDGEGKIETEPVMAEIETAPTVEAETIADVEIEKTPGANEADESHEQQDQTETAGAEGGEAEIMEQPAVSEPAQDAVDSAIPEKIDDVPADIGASPEEQQQDNAVETEAPAEE